LITAPENAFLLQHDTHQEYDKDFAWGIKAVCESDGTVSLQLHAIVSRLLLVDSLLHSSCPSRPTVWHDKSWHGEGGSIWY
jgi:hypothetical protein